MFLASVAAQAVGARVHDTAAPQTEFILRFSANFLQCLCDGPVAVATFLAQFGEPTLHGDGRARPRDHACPLVLFFFRCVTEFIAARAGNDLFVVESPNMLVAMLCGRDLFVAVRAINEPLVCDPRMVLERTSTQERCGVALIANKAPMGLAMCRQELFGLEDGLALPARELWLAGLSMRVALQLAREGNATDLARRRDWLGAVRDDRGGDLVRHDCENRVHGGRVGIYFGRTLASRLRERT